MKRFGIAALLAVGLCASSVGATFGQSFSDLVLNPGAKGAQGSFQAMVLGGGESDGATKGARAMGVLKRDTSFAMDAVPVDDASAEMVNVSMDRADRIYHLDDPVKISVTSTAAGYLYLFSVDCNGKPTLLLPNKMHRDNAIKANATQVYPTPDMGFDLKIVYGSGDFGKEKVVAYVTEKPLRATKSLELGDVTTTLTGAEANEVLAELNGLIEQNVAGRKGGIGVVAAGGVSTRPSPTPRPNPGLSNAARNATVGECVYTTVGTRRSASGQSQQQVRKTPERFVFCVGVNQYGDKSIQPLSLCANDAEKFAEAAQKYLGVKKEHACVLTNAQATLENVKNAICVALEQITKPGDEIIIYWSGHGGRMATELGAKNDAFLVPHDGDLDNPLDTMLTEDDFGRWIQQSLKGRRVMIFIDACHSGGLLEEPFAAKTLARAKSIGGDGVYVLASSCVDQFSFESRGDSDMSVMTHYLLDVFANGKRTTTHAQLKGLIGDKVERYTKKEYNATQTVVDYNGLRPEIYLLRD